MKVDTTVLGELHNCSARHAVRPPLTSGSVCSLRCPALAMCSRLVCHSMTHHSWRHPLSQCFRCPGCTCIVTSISNVVQICWEAPAGLSQEEAVASPFIASMGIYVFKKDLMLKLLREQSKSNDFGGEIIPSAAASSRVMAYLFNGYWEDIGTIKSFFEANLGLAQQVCSTLTGASICPFSDKLTLQQEQLLGR